MYKYAAKKSSNIYVKIGVEFASYIGIHALCLDFALCFIFCPGQSCYLVVWFSLRILF